ncbi:MAG: amino acid permease [Candidatus Bathyarchaeia archaeon]|jgi:amino acid transporter
MSSAFSRKTSGLIRQASLLDTFIYNSSASSFASVIGNYAFAVTFANGGDVLSALPLVLLAFSIAIVYAMLVSTFPRSGGDYVFNSRVLHPSLGFGFNFSLVFWQTFFLAFNFYLISFYGLGPGFHIIGYLLGNQAIINIGLALMTPLVAFVVGSLLNVVFTLLALSGTKRMLIANNAIWLIMIAGIGVALISLVLVGNQGFIGIFNSFMHSYGGQFGAAANPYQSIIDAANQGGYNAPPLTFDWPLLAIATNAVWWTFYSAYIAGEVKEAGSVKRNLFSMAGAGLFNLLFLALLFYYAFRTIGYNFLASVSYLATYNPQGLPWSNALEMITAFFGLVTQNPVLAALAVLGMALAGTLIYTVVIYLQISRNIFAWSMDRLMPGKLSEVSPRFHTPTYTNLAIFLICEAFLVIVAIFPDAFWTFLFSTIIGPAFSCMFLPGITAALLPYRRKDIYEASPIKREIIGIPIITIFGVIEAAFVVAIAYIFIAYPQFGISTPYALFLNFGMIAVGFVLYWIIRFIRARQGVDIDLAFKEIPPV